MACCLHSFHQHSSGPSQVLLREDALPWRCTLVVAPIIFARQVKAKARFGNLGESPSRDVFGLEKTLQRCAVQTESFANLLLSHLVLLSRQAERKANNVGECPKLVLWHWISDAH